MPRRTPQQLDDQVVDGAATLFARHGFEETSLRRIAEAVGFSKAGLLHHYPSKEALRGEVVQRCLVEVRMIAAGVAHRPPGPARDREALAALAELALRRPGFAELILSGLSAAPGGGEAVVLRPVVSALVEAFAVTTGADPVRGARVAGALGALVVASAALRQHPTSDEARHLVDLACDTLGHRRRADG
ncbi:TetR/AcrR family transcriptional regulator [Saccharothrix xinjiangensis]|uniref:TetR/AcrR family transcriptional regulator n=1 Tax=Saccharothrix xinjiangensis TaxID=204798 RepID=A0ABV9Y0J0_9PSEU